MPVRSAGLARGACGLPAIASVWKPFPDTNPALERLSRPATSLGILSNVDDDLLAGPQHFTVAFDLIVTAEQVGSYKPATAHFPPRANGRRPRWLHAAQSNFHDVSPAAMASRLPG